MTPGQLGRILAAVDRAPAAEVTVECNPDGVDADRLAALRAQVEFAHAEARRYDRPPIPVVPPCYFNTGCCSFGDGDVTGLEIADGQIRLVRWPNDEGEPEAKVLVEEDLRTVLASVGRPS
jgi:hypothetical protein